MYHRLVWVIYLVIAPLYIFKSGYPQPADFMLLLGLLPAGILLFMQSNIRIPTPMLIGLIFVALTFSINAIHFMFTPDKKFMLSSVYYVYNFSVFVFVIYLFSKAPKTMNRLTYWALAASIFIELLFVMFGESKVSSIRATGSFNNPSQLGYWSLLSIALLIVIKRDQKINAIDLALISMVFTTQLLSLSKAGILSMAFCFGILFCSKIVTNKQRILVCILAITGGFYLALSDSNIASRVANLDAFQAVYTRLSTIGTQGDDSLGGRGYTRITENPYYLILGAGEGGNWRYNIQAKELHSGLATLIFSYGIIGFTVFFTFIFFALRGLPWRYSMLIIPIMLYGLTHQNIRFTYFWVFLAAAYSGRFFERSIDELSPNHKDQSLFLNNSDIGKTPPRQNFA